MNGPSPEKCDVLLIAAQLGERRLLLGELIESGLDVHPVPGYPAALGKLLQHAIEPRLTLFDVQGDEHATPQSVEHLAGLNPGLLVLIVGSIDKELWEPLAGRVAELIHRPISIGQIVEYVKQRLTARRP
jgi:hypothetical protein